MCVTICKIWHFNDVRWHAKALNKSVMWLVAKTQYIIVVRRLAKAWEEKCG